MGCTKTFVVNEMQLANSLFQTVTISTQAFERLHLAFMRCPHARAIVLILDKPGSHLLYLQNSLRESRIAPVLFLCDNKTEDDFAKAVTSIIHWLKTLPGFGELPLGIYARHENAEAAIKACSQDDVDALVVENAKRLSKNHNLKKVKTPTLLIAEGSEKETTTFSEYFVGEKHFHFVPEPTTKSLAGVPRTTSLTRNWFEYHLTQSPIGQASGT